MGTDNKSCFIITPIGTDTSETRRAVDGVIDSVIIPVLNKLKFKEIVAAHHIAIPGSINNQIINKIINDDLVIANLTGLNANVMYELAIRHTTKKPIIHICEEGTLLPFDLKDQRTIFYKNDMKGVKDLKETLETAVIKTMEKEQWDDNPVYNAVKDKIFQEIVIEKPEKAFEKYLLEKIESLQDKVDMVISEKNIVTDTYKKSIRGKEYIVRVKVENGKEIDHISLSEEIFNMRLNISSISLIETNSADDIIEYSYSLRMRNNDCSYNELIKKLNENKKGYVFYSYLGC